MADRQLRLLRLILRDVLIGLIQVHRRGMAHLDLRLQNVHVSAADRHVKAPILGQAVRFRTVDMRERMIGHDIKWAPPPTPSPPPPPAPFLFLLDLVILTGT